MFTNEENMMTNLCYLATRTVLGIVIMYAFVYNAVLYSKWPPLQLNRADFSGVQNWLSSFDWVADFNLVDVPSVWKCFADRFTVALINLFLVESAKHLICMTQDASNLQKQKNRL